MSKYPNLPQYLPNIYMIYILRSVVKLQWIMTVISFQLMCITWTFLLRWVTLLWPVFSLNNYPNTPTKTSMLELWVLTKSSRSWDLMLRCLIYLTTWVLVLFLMSKISLTEVLLSLVVFLVVLLQELKFLSFLLSHSHTLTLRLCWMLSSCRCFVAVYITSSYNSLAAHNKMPLGLQNMSFVS